MVFSSVVFLYVFLPIVILGYYLLRFTVNKGKNLFLFIVSIAFYAWGEPKFVLVMLGSIIINYIAGLTIEKLKDRKRIARCILIAALVVNCAIFFVFKYLGFAVANINRLFKLSISIRSFALPIGISFFTFQAISYVIDVYRGKSEAMKNPLDVGLYIAFFPQLIAGPIVRYNDIAAEIKNREEKIEDFSYGVKRFVVGLGKKILLANQLAIVSDRVFNYINDSDVTVVMAWTGAIFYTLQIYFDFSGYSDMAIGLGRMFGFHFNENFNYPYIAKSVTDFWRRWHMSLSQWFRDYVYIPLGGSRVSKGRLVINLLVVWLLTGFWHGANWTFVLWGMIYFACQIVEKLTGINDKDSSAIIAVLRRLLTLIIVIICWVIFNSANISTAFIYIKKMFGLEGAVALSLKTVYIIKDNLILFVASVVFSIPWFGALKKRCEKGWRNKAVVILEMIFMLAVFVLSIATLTTSSYDPFIYFNF